jgi:POT family proton-dependent oligopeptide transporter
MRVIKNSNVRRNCVFEGKYPKQVFVLVEMGAFLFLWNARCYHFMADKILGLALSDKDANLKYGAIQAFAHTLL